MSFVREERRDFVCDSEIRNEEEEKEVAVVAVS